jgi:hypothetical protein
MGSSLQIKRTGFTCSYSSSLKTGLNHRKSGHFGSSCNNLHSKQTLCATEKKWVTPSHDLKYISTLNPWWKLCRKMGDQQFRLTCTKGFYFLFRWLMLYSDLIPLLVNTPGRPFSLMIHDLCILPILKVLPADSFAIGRFMPAILLLYFVWRGSLYVHLCGEVERC